MSSDELIKTLYQISDSFKETSLWPTIRLIGSLIILGVFVICYIVLDLWEAYILRKILKRITNESPTTSH
jgi:hypothetical protein